MRGMLLAALLLGGLIFLVGCGGGSGTPQVKQHWTVLVYMAADNDLEGAAIDDINEMEQIGSTEDVTVLVQLDRSPGYDTTNGNWKGARRYRIEQDDDPDLINPTLLETLGDNVNSGSPTALRDFIVWGQTYAPADRYLVILWNHGMGWSASDRSAPASRAICYDDTSRTAIRVTELPAALTGQAPIDILATDACLMAMLEVAYEVRNQAKYLVASEEESAWKGYAYQRVLGKLASAEGLLMTASEFAAFMAQDAYAEWSPVDSTATTCAIDLSKVAAVAQAADSLATRLRDVGSQYAAGVRQAQADAESFSPGSFTQRADLYHYCDLLTSNVTDGAVQSRAGQVKAAITQAVVANYHTAGHPQAHGISVYLPTAQEYTRAITTYGNYYPQLAFARNTAWEDWLAAQPAAQ